MGAVQDLGEVQRYRRHIGVKEHPPPIGPARSVQAELVYDDRAYEQTFTESFKYGASQDSPLCPKPPVTVRIVRLSSFFGRL